MKTWTFKDKSAWPDKGQWTNEPDKAQWVDEQTGLDCLMVRAHTSWCGYVGVQEGHPAYGTSWDTCPDVDVHGGVTFGGLCQEGDHEPRVCHVPEMGGADKVWWIGFDCAHCGDYRPSENRQIYDINRKFKTCLDEQYRDFDYVKGQVTSLAHQLGEMKGVGL